MIYIVTKGDYSDYHIVAATTNRELAEKIRKKFADEWDECKIEEFPDAEVMLKKLWNVYFDDSGNALRCHITESEYDYHEKQDIIDPICKRYYNMIVKAEADTEEAAIKIAAEKRAKYLAEKYHL